MTFNRADLARVYAYGRALSEAAKELLEGDARYELEHNETALSARLPFGSVSASIRQDTLAVTDDQAFLEWLRLLHPTEVVEVLTVRNPEWLRARREALYAEIRTGGRDVPPGTTMITGGALSHVAVTLDASVRNALARRARAVLQGGDTLPGVAELFAPDEGESDV